MFSNPLFEWWMESLEERRLRSAGDDGVIAPPPLPEPAQQGLSSEAPGPGQEGGVVTDGIRIELRRLADELPGGADEAFINEWCLGDDAPGA